MLEIVRLLARTLDQRSVQLSWETKPTTEETLDYWFQVLRAEAEGGPWQELTEQFTDKFLFCDSMVEVTNPLRRLFYMLRVTSKTDATATNDFGPASVGDEPDLIAAEVRRTWDVVKHELNGRRCWLLPVRTFGSTCRNCYDVITQRVTKSGCLSCYGTGFVRGFHHPIEIWLNFQPVPRSLAVGQRVSPEQATKATAGYFPTVKPKDLIVESNNRRWRVGPVEVSERLGATLHQELTLAEVSISDPEQQVPIDPGALRSLELAAPANYAYATTV